MSIPSDRVLDYCLGHRSRLISRLQEYVRCQSVSTDPAYATGMENARSWLEEYLDDNGFEHVQRLDGQGHPSLYARPLFLRLNLGQEDTSL